MSLPRLAAVFLTLWLAAVPAAGQDGSADGLPRSPVLTLDQERFFAESAFGQRVRRELEEAASALAAENRRIESELSAEERDLTERRPDMDPEEFRELADAFDRKVVEIRQRQDQKARDLDARAEAERQRFFDAALPILLEIIREAGAVALLEDRAIILSADRIEITDRAIRRVNAQLGDGREAAGGAE
ncbi:OmpH family outer membrane protein [Rhodovulum sp. YNF3179]|uniref:OmpH family outer membrane protein n=1 Tax=Rhodovulum sp. YNF3179 TaxID=3425127 RepID=UPI003D3533F0